MGNVKKEIRIEMKTILANWNIFRLARLILGLAVVVSGIMDHEWMFAVAGGFLCLFALTNTGCCGNGCGVAISKDTGQKRVHVEQIELNERPVTKK
jgi:hypothetical protein